MTIIRLDESFHLVSSDDASDIGGARGCRLPLRRQCCDAVIHDHQQCHRAQSRGGDHGEHRRDGRNRRGCSFLDRRVHHCHVAGRRSLMPLHATAKSAASSTTLLVAHSPARRLRRFLYGSIGTRTTRPSLRNGCGTCQCLLPSAPAPPRCFGTKRASTSAFDHEQRHEPRSGEAVSM
jgi:hypothetical protein